MFCKKCGMENKEQAKFCKKCGAVLNGGFQETAETFSQAENNGKKRSGKNKPLSRKQDETGQIVRNALEEAVLQPEIRERKAAEGQGHRDAQIMRKIMKQSVNR